MSWYYAVTGGCAASGKPVVSGAEAFWRRNNEMAHAKA